MGTLLVFEAMALTSSGIAMGKQVTLHMNWQGKNEARGRQVSGGAWALSLHVFGLGFGLRTMQKDLPPTVCLQPTYEKSPWGWSQREA